MIYNTGIYKILVESRHGFVAYNQSEAKNCTIHKTVYQLKNDTKKITISRN